MISRNWVAYIALLLWPVMTLVLDSRFVSGKATLWTILSAYLLLPVSAEIKFVGVRLTKTLYHISRGAASNAAS